MIEVIVYWGFGVAGWPLLYAHQGKSVTAADLLFISFVAAWIWPVAPLIILVREANRFMRWANGITIWKGREPK